MKTDLATSVAAAIIGVVAAFLLCNMLVPGAQDVKFSILGSSDSYTLSEPDPEIFNYRAVNPTVEVYVGQCKQYNANGECIDYGTKGDTIEQETQSSDSSSTESSGDSANYSTITTNESFTITQPTTNTSGGTSNGASN